jgi:hypothetical protein
MASTDYTHWKEPEILKLFDAVEDQGITDWDRVSLFVGTRTPEQCRQKWYRISKKGEVKESLKQIPKKTAKELKSEKKREWIDKTATTFYKKYGPAQEPNEAPEIDMTLPKKQASLPLSHHFPKFEPGETKLEASDAPECPKFHYWSVTEKDQVRYIWQVPAASYFVVKLEKDHWGDVIAKARIDMNIPEEDAKFLKITTKLPTRTYETVITLPTRSIKAVNVIKKDTDHPEYRQMIVNTTVGEEESAILTCD